MIGPDGGKLGLVPVPEASNCAFGDEDAKTLYIAAGPSVFKVRLTEPGTLPGPAR